MRRRQLILDFVERFRTAYNQRDIQFLNQIFSDDALIITGKVVKQQTRDGIKLPDKVEFFKRSKHEYIANLKAQFNKVKYITEPTLKSKACLKCLYFTIIIFDLCRYLEYFSYLYTINQTE